MEQAKNLPAVQKPYKQWLTELQTAQTGVKVYERSEHDIRIAIAKICILLGVPDSKIPDAGYHAKVASGIPLREDEKPVATMVMVDYIKRNYTLLSLEEILIAVEYAVARKFIVDLKLYDSPFSTELLGRILEGWKTHKQILVSRAAKEKEEQIEPERIPASPKELFDGLTEYISKNGKAPHTWDWDSVYDHAKESGLIRDTYDEQMIFLDIVKAELAEEAEMKSKMSQRPIEPIPTGEALKTECRKRRVLAFIKNV